MNNDFDEDEFPIDPNQKWEPCWVECPDCGDFICTQHDNQHVADCPCPPVDVWAEHDVWPYVDEDAAEDIDEDDDDAAYRH